MRENSVYSGRLAYRALMSAKESRMATINGGVGNSNMQMMKNGEGYGSWMFYREYDFFGGRPKGIVPDNATLTKRHVRVDTTCSVCKTTSATLYHAMMECGHVKRFWLAARDIVHLKLPIYTLTHGRYTFYVTLCSVKGSGKD
jgi:hypothetical protein